MNSLHLLTLRYLILLDLLALHQIVKFLWTHDCMAFQELMLSIKHAVVGTRIRAYWWSCQEALESFNPAAYLIEGANEFVLDLSPNKYTLPLVYIEYLSTQVLIYSKDWYTLNNLLDDIKEGWLSLSHYATKRYPIVPKCKLVRLYCETA